MYISSNDKVVRAKKGTGGLHLVKTVDPLLQISSKSYPSCCGHRGHHPHHLHHPHDHPEHPPQVQAIIIASYAEPVTAEQCAVVTEKLGDYLVSVGY